MRLKIDFLFLLFTLSALSANLVYAQSNPDGKPIDFNKSHVIATVATGDRDEYTGIPWVLRMLQDRLPHGFELLEVKDEKEASHDKFWGILFVNYERKTYKTQWMIRHTAINDKIAIGLDPKEEYFSTNWKHISEEGYSRPSSSTHIFDYNGTLAVKKIPYLEITFNTSNVSLLLVALKDSSKAIRIAAVEKIAILKDHSALEPLISLLKDEEYVVRRGAIKALGELKDRRAVADLIDILKKCDFDPVCSNAAEPLSRSAVKALIEITGNDIGEDPKKWIGWWKKNKEK